MKRKCEDTIHRKEEENELQMECCGRRDNVLIFLGLKSELVWEKKRIMGWWKERKKVEWREMIEEKIRSRCILFG